MELREARPILLNTFHYFLDGKTGGFVPKTAKKDLFFKIIQLNKKLDSKVENIKKSVFKIITASGTGSGFAVSGHNHVITNYHVVKGEKIVAVEDYKRDRFVANVVMVNPEVDLASYISMDLRTRRPIFHYKKKL